MSRRCKPGQRARVIGSGPNVGKIVVVVRPYFYPEQIADACWPNNLYPWVVTSLAAPLNWSSINNPGVQGASMTIVLCDLDLEPLKDDEDGLTRSTERKNPKPAGQHRRPTTVAAITNS